MPGNAFLKAFWNSECLLQNILHLKLVINCCSVDATAQYALQTAHAMGVGGLVLAFYLFLGYLDLRGIPEITAKKSNVQAMAQQTGLTKGLIYTEPD